MVKTANKLRPTTDQQNTRIGELIASALEAQGKSIRDLAEGIEVTYEHARRMAKGEGVPSRAILKEICRFLKLDFKEAEKAVTADRINKQYGILPIELTGKNPELEPIERDWKWLSEEQKQAVITMVHGWAKVSKAMAKG